MRTLFLALALCVASPSVAAAQGAGAPAPGEVSMELRRQLAAGWTYYESGNFRKAIEVLVAALATPEGDRNAELHYLLGSIWWDKRDAASAMRWWSMAEAKAKERYDWNPSGDYNARIQKRLVFVRTNFGTVKLRTAGARSLPPQADPMPKDPVLAEFVAAAAGLIAEATRTRDKTAWIALPKGNYWVGDERLTLAGGGMDMAQAPEWALVRGVGAAKKAFEMRAAGGAPGPSTAVAATTGADADRFDARLGHVALGGGGAVVPAQTGDGEVAGTVHVEAGVAIPLGVPGVALAVGASYADLPVSGCSSMQTRAGVVAGHVGPRLSKHLTGRLWLSGEVGFHVGGGFAERTADDRTNCALARLGSDAGEVRYGATVGPAGEAVSFAQLGWDGGSLALGPHGEIGVLGAPGQAPLYLGVSFFARYDQVFAVTGGGTAWYPTDSGVESAEVGALSGAASMSRLQFGVRGRVKF